MKKILCAFFALLMLLGSTSLAKDENIMEFEPMGGGKFIYCNNPEELVREDLADDGETPEFLMNNSDLEPDNYRLYLTHFNRVTKTDEEGNVYPGENIYLDAVFTAKEDCELEILRTAFEIPANITTYLNYETIKTEDTWSGIYACADLIGQPIYTLHSDKVFEPRKQNTHTVTLKRGESFFLSEYIDNYEGVPYPKHVMMAADFEIKSGSADVDIFAAKNRRVYSDGGVRYPDIDFENCGFGIYKRGRTHKGIADSLPEMQAFVEYEITDKTAKGAYIPVKVFNQYYPKGSLVTEWTTNLNPQDDIYAKNLIAESNILPLEYEDESKKSYYGENVAEEDRNSVWIFDNYHSDTMEYPGEGCGIAEADYSPNYELATDRDNIGYACSMGNYGVTLWYNLKITNSAAEDKYLDYTVMTAANVIVEVKDSDGEYLQPVVSKGQTNELTADTMASVLLPKGETTEFSIGMTLPVQNYGGQRQSFRISDVKTELEFKENKQVKPVAAQSTKPIDAENLIKHADEKTRSIFEGNENDLCIVKTDNGYAAYYDVVEGNPWYYGYYWQITGKVFVLDEDFNIVKELYLGSQPIEMTFAESRIYIKTIANGSFYLDEDLEPQPFDSYILPRESDEAVVIARDNNLTVSLDGENYYNVEFQSITPPFSQMSGNVFYYATKDSAGGSADGIYWETVTPCEDITEVMLYENHIKVNGNSLGGFSGAKTPRILLNDTYLGFDSPPYTKGENGRIYLPIRFIFEKLGMRVIFDGKNEQIIAFGENSFMKFKTGSSIAEVNGREVLMDAVIERYMDRTYVPLRFLLENCGFDVSWDEEPLTAVITGKTGEMPGEIELDGDISVIILEDDEKTEESLTEQADVKNESKSDEKDSDSSKRISE